MNIDNLNNSIDLEILKLKEEHKKKIEEFIKQFEEMTNNTCDFPGTKLLEEK